MLYSVLVVEDEILLRKHFIQTINWGGYQCGVVYECGSAEEAIAYMEESGFPDILFTDICLLQMNGIDLCRYVQEGSPQTKKVILTGYSDFEYAKQAIEYNVDEYLLKPVHPQSVEKILALYTHELFVLRHNAQELAGIRELVRKKRKHYIADFLAELANDTEMYNEEDTLPIARELDFVLGDYYYIVIKYRQRDSASERLPVSLQLRNFLEEHFSCFGECYLFNLEYRRICCVFTPTDEKQNPEEILKSMFSKISLLNTNLAVSAGISLRQNGLQTVHKAHMQASIACNYDFYFGSGSIIPFQPIFNRQIDMPEYINDLNDGRIVSQLMVGNWEDASNLLKKKLAELRAEKKVTMKMLQGAAIDLVTIIYKKIYALNTEYSSHVLSEDILLITNASSIDEIEKALLEIIQTCGEDVQRRFLHHTHKAVSTILDYINQNYAQQITLEDLSKLVYLNAKYICAIIKKDTGKTFYEILTEIRVMKAKELLYDTSVKMYQVSQRTGFYDAKAFNTAFKKVTGLTPTQYRRHIQGIKA